MQSPGKYHEGVPREPQENLRFRKHVLDRCLVNPRYRAAVLEACRQDFLFYVNTFVWQSNPDRVGREIEPFISWDYQDRGFRVMLDALNERHDLCIEKSREMGATWMCLILEDWVGKFFENKALGVISRDADAVDDGTLNSLLPKLDFINSHQPEWLTGEIERKTKGMLRRFRRTRSLITGEASTGKAFVGGRLSMLFVDEFSQIAEGNKVRQRTRDVTKCRIFNFTHVGAGGHAYDLAQEPDIHKLVMHWSHHPRKNPGLYRHDPTRPGVPHVIDKTYHFPPEYVFVLDGSPGGPFAGLRSPWYDNECGVRKSSRAVAEDLDIDPAASTRQFFDQLRVMEHKRLYATDPVWSGDLAHDPDSGTPRELVPAPNGPLKLWLQPDRDGKPPRARYAVACDVAAGTGASNSTVCIADMLTGEKVGEFASPNIYPDPFARLVVSLCRLFGDEDGDTAMLCWEMQGSVGSTFAKAVKELGYSRLHFAQEGYRGRTVTEPGWSNTGTTLAILLRDYAGALYAGHFINRSDIALDECLKFQYTAAGRVEHTGFARGERDDPSGARENHGDRVVADAQAWLMMRHMVLVKAREAKDEEPEHPFGSHGWRQSLRKVDEAVGWLDPRRRAPREAGVTVWSGGR